MHHLSLHITTTQNADKIFSAVHRVVCRSNYGTVFWSITEGEKTEMGLVVYKEKKARLKEIGIRFYDEMPRMNKAFMFKK